MASAELSFCFAAGCRFGTLVGPWGVLESVGSLLFLPLIAVFLVMDVTGSLVIVGPRDHLAANAERQLRLASSVLMGIVRFALRFPHTFYVMAALILFLGISAVTTTPKDIFPTVNIPVVSVIWQYTGLTPQEMEQRITTYSEYSISSNVNDIKNMESETLEGISVEKIFFQPTFSIDLAVSQIVSASNAIRAVMPAGRPPPSA